MRIVKQERNMHFSTFFEWLQSVKSIHYPLRFRLQNYKKKNIYINYFDFFSLKYSRISLTLKKR